MFVLGLFKMVANQMKCSKPKQRYVMKLYVAEKCKPCDIYGIQCNGYVEASFSQNMFTNELNMGLPQRISSPLVNKEGHAHSLLGFESTHLY